MASSAEQVPPAPTSDRALSVLRDLEQAATGQHVAWCLSGALDTLRKLEQYPQISREERHSLLFASGRAFEAAAALPPGLIFDEDLHAGFAALAGLVCLWAEDAQARALRPNHVRLDLFARARIFQNHAHNASLTEEIAERAFEQARHHSLRHQLRLVHDREAK
ncbi:hypothetical protein GCM10007036_16560 [Alsobacter metallidurans]|uniref:Uncharacterized protein n=1 Tax=Alsobacter metallidurans TaxID=340221 RepID=A0A917MHC6_9HYPH|nr:hypothetical protein [Alsobacter metallidurans]GGH16125.1 hypothetical protein GCM10007036_16560 [Alsobacter metallidurans]